MLAMHQRLFATMHWYHWFFFDSDFVGFQYFLYPSARSDSVIESSKWWRHLSSSFLWLHIFTRLPISRIFYWHGLILYIAASSHESAARNNASCSHVKFWTKKPSVAIILPKVAPRPACDWFNGPVGAVDWITCPPSHRPLLLSLTHSLYPLSFFLPFLSLDSPTSRLNPRSHDEECNGLMAPSSYNRPIETAHTRTKLKCSPPVRLPRLRSPSSDLIWSNTTK